MRLADVYVDTGRKRIGKKRTSNQNSARLVIDLDHLTLDHRG